MTYVPDHKNSSGLNLVDQSESIVFQVVFVPPLSQAFSNRQPTFARLVGKVIYPDDLQLSVYLISLLVHPRTALLNDDYLLPCNPSETSR